MGLPMSHPDQKVYVYTLSFVVLVLGRNIVIITINGKNAHNSKICCLLVLSSILPKMAEPTPATPNANPKNNPAIIPTFPGIKSVAYTKIAENAEDIISPIRIAKTTVAVKPVCGNSKVKGAAPKIEIQMINLRP